MMVSEKSTLRKENAYTFSPPIGFKSARIAYGTEEAFSLLDVLSPRKEPRASYVGR
jgi:hypothetical protein